MPIPADDRRARILDAVRALGTVRVADLAERLGLPAVTVRRDVAALADAGLLRRTHGSVAFPAPETDTAPGPAAGPARPAGGPALGLLVPAVVQYFDEVIAGARTAAAGAGAHLVLGISSYEASADRVQVEQLLATGVQGLLLAPNWTAADRPEDQAWVAGLPVPAVLLERRPIAGGPAAGLDSVGSDHRHGVLLALRHLAGRGHRRIALAARADTWTAHQVRSGYDEACRILGLTAGPVLDVRTPAADLDRVARQLAEAAADGVGAALVHNDQDAIQLLPLLRAGGVRVPEDLALVSYDDVFAALGAPPLTAVAPPKRAVGAAAVDLLLRRLATADEPLPVHHLELLPDLKVRESSGG
ncbi:substrate-binding domain-containing protein [Kitasatospora sp. NPDC056327]|uniref:substrate-binding domain-containing protein n=1 Tax=Kitasatospora sp. NPDC056327 TaxID=3345785 RepID=UPI0035D76DB4